MIAGLLGAVVGAAGVAFVWRRRTAAAATSAHAEVAAAHEELADARRSSAAERQVQDVILSSMEEGVLLLARDGNRVFANEALERHLGAAPSGTTDLLPASLRQVVTRAGFTGAPGRLEFEAGPPTRWLRASALPVGGDGSVLLVVGDVTEARRLDAVRRDFVANASHELKTPVAAIRASAETLRDGAIDDPPAAKRFTQQLERDALRLSRIVGDLLDLSRLESGSDLQERVHLDVVAADEAARLGDAARDAGISLRVEADVVGSIRGSSRDLALLVRNLIDNAVRYTAPGGTVTVTVRPAAEGVALRVADTGPGIPARDLPRIFERFYRVDRARSRETGGTGLGLAIVKHVAENHGGTVDVKSELGLGTSIEVTFPREPAGRAS